ncbi:MAG TPA: 50S ribosomal protein L20 [Chloroflexia bacterium]|nr:50S ribosomal protein L20 [Chloroflexia bacterium]
MPRVKRGFTRHRRHAKVLDQVKGHQTSRGHLFRSANQELLHSLAYAYRDRRTRKREMRGLWIIRINAAARENGLPYNRFIAGVNALGLGIDRKMLAEMAVNDPHGFSVLAARVKGEADPIRPAAVAPAAPKATKAERAARAQAAADTVTIAPTADADSAEDTVLAAQPGSVETIAEEEAAAAGEPLKHAGTKDEQEEGHGDSQQGTSR